MNPRPPYFEGLSLSLESGQRLNACRAARIANEGAAHPAASAVCGEHGFGLPRPDRLC